MDWNRENKLPSPTVGRRNKVHGLRSTPSRLALSNVVSSEDMEFEPEPERSPKVASKLNDSDGGQPKIKSFLKTLPKANDSKGGEPRRMLDFVSPDSGFEREHEVKRLLKTPSKVKDSNGGAPKAQTKKGMRLKTKSSKEKKVGRTRIYSDEAREAIAKMALNEGDRKAADHYTKEFGHSVNRSTVNSFKRAYMKNRNKNGGKGSVELQNPVSQDEIDDLNNMKVQDKEVYSGDEDKEVGDNLDKKVGGNQDKEVGGNAILDQVKKEQNQVETDVICDFDPRAAYVESQLAADMKKFGETEQEIVMLEQRLLQRKKEKKGLAKKIGDRLASGEVA